MARIFKRPRSPFWWIEYRDPNLFETYKSGRRKVVMESTGFRIGVGSETRQAHELAAQRTLDEFRCRPLAGLSAELWDNWVPAHFTRCVSKKIIGARSAERYRTAWRTLRMWLREIKIEIPRQLTYSHCDGYTEWRQKPDKRNGKYAAGQNTAVLEFKLLRWLLREAVRRGFCTSNPAREVTVKREPRRRFALYSDEQLQALFDFIATEPEPARTQFRRCLLLAWYHGVRLNETNVNPLTDVRLWKAGGIVHGEITFLQKGGRTRTKPLHPRLVSLFEKLQAEGATRTYPALTWDSGWSGMWFRLLTRSGLKAKNPNLTFHSVRKTVQNVLRREKIPREIVMEYLTHDQPDRNKVVHDDYTEVSLEEMRACHAPLDRDWGE